MNPKNISLIILSFVLASSFSFASCGGGSGSSTNPSLVAPSGLSATAGDAKVTLEWNAVDGADSYVLYWDTTAGITKTITKASQSIEATTSSYVHEGLTNATTYYYAIAAKNSAGEGDLSAEVSATPQLGLSDNADSVPGAPQGLAIAAGNKQLSLDWDAVDGATSYNIYWNITAGINADTPNRETSTADNYVHIDLSNLNTYFYRVAAVNAAGEGTLSEEKSATPEFSQAEIEEIAADTPAASDEFGYAVAISGDTAIIGAPHYNANNGTAFVYRYASGQWSKEAELAPPGAITTNGTYGQAVAISGNYAIVGNPTGNGNVNFSGLAVVFKRTGTTWAQEQTLMASDGANGDKFGKSVAISSGYAAVGASDDDFGGKIDCGSMYFWSTSNWAVETAIHGAGDNDKYGYSVAISGNVGAVGAPYNDANALNGGAVYIYSLNSLTLDLFYGGDDTNGLVGSCVSIDDDVAIAGLTGKQSAIILRYTGGAWAEEQEVTPSSSTAGDKFGESCSISDDYAVVGAYLNDDTAADAGAAFVFKNASSTWSEEAKLLASDGAAGDQFGVSVGIYEDLIVIGANFVDQGAVVDAGAAYFY
ncbi:MAG: hypothetical protein ABH871_05475 [Pseudomonadota bacterium]